MFRFTIRRCMHDRKIPNITSSYVFPPVVCSYDSPKKYEQSKPIKKEPKTWKNVWPKYRVHSQQYREYKATRGDGQPISSWNRQTAAGIWKDADATGTGVRTPRPHEHAEAEEEAIWGEVGHDYTHIDSVETGDDDCLRDDKFKKLFNREL
jgi:hypothetical protein